MITCTSVLLTWTLLRRAETLAGTSDLPAVVVAPHQDDETFGCGGVIAMKRQQGVPVSVVYVSDGGGSARKPGVSPEEIIATREREARKATSLLGVDAGEVYFLRFPDTQLAHLESSSREAVVTRLRTLIDRHAKLEVFVTHKRDMHPDHEATFRLVREAVEGAKADVRLFEYPVWIRWMGKFHRNLQWSDFPGLVKISIAPVHHLKLQAIQAYVSQISALGRGHLRCFEQRWEIFVERSRSE
jgi:LmbE family N-acetylglucosaminyl deacetylase